MPAFNIKGRVILAQCISSTISALVFSTQQEFQFNIPPSFIEYQHDQHQPAVYCDWVT